MVGSPVILRVQNVVHTHIALNVLRPAEPVQPGGLGGEVEFRNTVGAHGHGLGGIHSQLLLLGKSLHRHGAFFRMAAQGHGDLGGAGTGKDQPYAIRRDLPDPDDSFIRGFHHQLRGDGVLGLQLEPQPVRLTLLAGDLGIIQGEAGGLFHIHHHHIQQICFGGSKLHRVGNALVQQAQDAPASPLGIGDRLYRFCAGVCHGVVQPVL